MRTTSCALCAASTRGMRLIRISFDGFEKVELLVPIVLTESGQVLSRGAAAALLQRGDVRRRRTCGVDRR